VNAEDGFLVLEGLLFFMWPYVSPSQVSLNSKLKETRLMGSKVKEKGEFRRQMVSFVKSTTFFIPFDEATLPP